MIFSGGKDINDFKVMIKLLVVCEVKMKNYCLNKFFCFLLVLYLLLMNSLFVCIF